MIRDFPTTSTRPVAGRGAPRQVAAMLVGAALLAAGVGCSDDGDTTTERGSTRSTTTTSAPTSAPDDSGGGPTTTAVPDVWTPAGEPSPLLLGVGQPEPEFPAGKDGSVPEIPDGKYDTLVVQVDASAEVMLVDVVQLLLGAEGNTQAIADGRILDGDELPAEYYIRNISPKMRQLGLAPTVELAPEAAGQAGAPEPASGSGAVAEALIARLGVAPGIPYRMTVSGGLVTSILVPDIVDPTLQPAGD